MSEVLRAAAWIVGEYSETITMIANDVGDDSLDESDDEEGLRSHPILYTTSAPPLLIDETAFWIEATTGEEIRSIWKGQKVHVMVMNALLDAKVTNLSSHVQVSST